VLLHALQQGQVDVIADLICKNPALARWVCAAGCCMLHVAGMSMHQQS
jgi:hypothetical protein